MLHPALPETPQPPASIPPLTYGRMRWRQGRAALQAFVARWGLYLLVAGVLFGAGTSNPLTLVLAAASWLVLPLFLATAQGAWLVLALPMQAMVGAALVWGARPLLWPAHWAEAERALPLQRKVTLRSDILAVLAVLTPLGLLYAAGAATLLVHRPAWLQPVQAAAVLSLCLAWAASAALAVWGLQRLRAAPRRARVPASTPPVGRAPGSAASSATRPVPPAAVGWMRALLWWPLWRGPARRTGRSLVGGLVLLLTPSGGLMLSGAGEPWWLALASLLSLAVCTRVHRLAQQEFAALHAASAWLPLPARSLRRARQALGLWPVLPTLALLAGTVLALDAPTLRPPMLLAWVLVCLGSCVAEVGHARAGDAVRDGSADASSRAARWLFSLVLCGCIGTEVLA